MDEFERTFNLTLHFFYNVYIDVVGDNLMPCLSYRFLLLEWAIFQYNVLVAELQSWWLGERRTTRPQAELGRGWHADVQWYFALDAAVVVVAAGSGVRRLPNCVDHGHL